MPRSLSRRIVLAIIVFAAATWLAIGATLFVVLRTLHTDATTARLSDSVAPLANQVRQSLADGDARTILAALRAQVAGTDYGLYVLTADGRMVALEQNEPDLTGLRINAAAGRGDLDRGTFRAPNGQGYAWAASVLRNAGTAGPRALVLAVEDRAGADALRDVLSSLPVVIVVSLLVGVPIAFLLGRSVVGPIRRLTEASGGLASTRTFEPLPLEGPTELRDLTARFNAMAAELASSRKQEAELLANLRHDLRTPLTVIGGFAAALSDGTATGPDAAKAALAIGEEAERLEHLVAELGAFERLRTAPAGLRPEPLDVAALLASTAARFRTTAEARGVSLIVLHQEAGPTLLADRVAVDRILANLVSNALAAFGPKAAVDAPPPSGNAPGGIAQGEIAPGGIAPGRIAPGRIAAAQDAGAPVDPTSSAATLEPVSGRPPIGHVWLDARLLGDVPPGSRSPSATADSAPPMPGGAGGLGHVPADGRGVGVRGDARGSMAPAPAVVLSVTDDGPGFPPGATERVFERFFRGDPARAGGGSGLGLAIVRELARAHGGWAVAENVAPRGARVSVILPLVPPPVGPA